MFTPTGLNESVLLIYLTGFWAYRILGWSSVLAGNCKG